MNELKRLLRRLTSQVSDRVTRWWQGGGKQALQQRAERGGKAIRELASSDTAKQARSKLHDLRESDTAQKAQAKLRDLRDSDTAKKAQAKLRDLRESTGGAENGQASTPSKPTATGRDS